MAVIIGSIVVLVAVLVGFTMAGGDVASLVHPSEFVTIGGASFGALIIMSPKRVLMELARGIIGLIKGTPYNTQTCRELLRLLYALARTARKDGILALEAHVSEPDKSELFQQHQKVSQNHHLRGFLCNAVSLLVDGMTAAQLNCACEEEIQVVEREHHAAVVSLTKTADALPGFGIVAAVLGIVVTMQAIDGPVEEIGHKVGAALVGTFLGILLSYGFFAPMAGRMESLGEQEIVFLRAISAAVLAMSEGARPKDVAMRALRLMSSDCRPSHAELREVLGEV